MKQAMSTQDRCCNGDRAERQQQPVAALHEYKCRMRIDGGATAQPFMQEQRLADEQNEGKQQPDQQHGVHPPVTGIEKPVPGAEAVGEIEAGEAGDGHRDPGLAGKPSLDGLEQGMLPGRLGEAGDGGQDNQCHHGHAADPVDHRQHVQDPGKRDVSHAATIRPALLRQGVAMAMLPPASVL